MLNPTIGVRAQMQSWFFDRPEVLRRIGMANARRLRRAGAFIRRRAQTDILRRRKGVSAPGQPPHVHSRDRFASLRNIQFFLDRSGEALIVGPVKLNLASRDAHGSKTVPELLEFGGTAAIDEEQFIGSDIWYRRDRRRRGSPNKRYRTRTARYTARPFMGPALEKEIAAGTLQDLFARIA